LLKLNPIKSYNQSQQINYFFSTPGCPGREELVGEAHPVPEKSMWAGPTQKKIKKYGRSEFPIAQNI
jgi:hypothetical protein